jgi:hypothetical protein
MNNSTKIFLGLLVAAGIAGGAWYLLHAQKAKAGTHKYNVGDQLEAWGTTLYTVQQVFTAVGPPSQPNFTPGALYYLLVSGPSGTIYLLCSTVDNSESFVPANVGGG